MTGTAIVSSCCCCQGISKEDSKLDPWTLIAKHKLAAEKALADIPGYVYVLCIC